MLLREIIQVHCNPVVETIINARYLFTVEAIEKGVSDVGKFDAGRYPSL